MKLTYVTNEYGEWCGVYIDGKLDTEGHSIPVYEWLDYIKMRGITEVEELEVSGEWMEDVGSFPQLFDDIPKEKFV